MKKVWKALASVALSMMLCFGVVAIERSATQEVVLTDAAAGSYYSGITAQNGKALLGQIHDLIANTHSTYTTYNDCKNPTYVKQTDPGTNSSSVREFYSQANIAASWGSGAVGTWNREHVWCQSLSNGLWGESGGGSDLHHIRPVETRLNSTRGNNKYGLVSNRESKKVYYKDANGGIIADGGYNGGGTYEPLDEVKGDVARIVMYVYTHYNSYSNSIFGGYATTNGNGGKFGTLNFLHVMSAGNEDAAIKMLLDWNESDPVDDIERTRNEAVYEIQGNRNPFIDNEDYAKAIWGNGSTAPGGDTPGGGNTQPDDNLTGIERFHAAVEAIVPSGSIEERLAAINNAIAAYRALSENEKASANSDFQNLLAKISDYNQTIGAYNDDAESANKAVNGR